MKPSIIKSTLIDNATIRDKGLGEVTVMDIDPSFAAQLLSTRSDRQRPIDIRKVTNYGSDMRAGLWHSNGESYQLDRNLKLINGQHRCMAIVETGIIARSQMIVILSGTAVPKDDSAIMTIDQGKGRTFRDMQVIAGDLPLSRSLTGAIIAEHFSWDGWRNITNQERRRIVEDFDPSLLEDIRRLEQIGPRRSGLFTVGTASAAIRCLRKNREAAMQFFSAVFAFDHIVYGKSNAYARLLFMYLRTQTGLNKDNTAAQTTETSYKTIRAWNAWRNAENITKLQSPRTPGKMLDAVE